MNRKQLKFENPARLDELKPRETLLRIGLTENDTVCDIGAGTGVFTLPAAEITRNTVYALDINEDMLAILDDKIQSGQIKNIVLQKVRDKRYDLEDGSIAIALMVTVLHEVESKLQIIKEIKRILKENGKLAVIEFHKRPTTSGPPVEQRLSQDEVKEMMAYSDFTTCDEFDLGDNFYCLVFVN
ncbi:methyltransferase domain-containing protein [Dehalobacter sp. DCM]|uniref:class I SAM-dependent methyltransferase n=1 Tax=Dehalobacter sp. DCM TaxID=2907827 RepID=UPI003081DB6D|nr:methyltransferase domain-containing protein [Dehalobacter sp. DCM]